MIFTVYFTETQTGQEHVAEYDCMDEREAEELFLNDFGGQAVIDGIDCDELGEDDGQPTMYEEYQDLYGGDDQFETCNYYGEE